MLINHNYKTKFISILVLGRVILFKKSSVEVTNYKETKNFSPHFFEWNISKNYSDHISKITIYIKCLSSDKIFVAGCIF